MSNTYEKCYEGCERCTIKPIQIMAPSMQRNKEMTAQVMQGAFNTYYSGWKAVDRISDIYYSRTYSKPAKDKIYALKNAMQKDLKSACCTGWYDLHFTFKHMYENNGSFYDDNWDGYKGYCNIPMGVSNFIQTIEKRGGKFSQSASDFLRAQQEAQRQAKLGQWEKVGEQLGSIKSNLETYGPYLWVCIPGNPGKAPHYVELIAKCIDYAGQIHGTLDKGLKAEQTLDRAKNDPNFKKDLFVETMAAVVGRLPVMGPLYAEVIKGVPNAIAYFTKIAKERDATINEILR
ncbi:MAG: hypothetical protein NW208_19080 [Bryobacter sp.]|nr:hypothetical protein [Bryobacter sp.]